MKQKTKQFLENYLDKQKSIYVEVEQFLSETKRAEESSELPKYGGHFKHKILCENGYGISLVYHKYSYGLECALIHEDIEGIIQDHKEFNDFCVGDSVKGYMNGNDLSDVLNLVKSFPKTEKA